MVTEFHERGVVFTRQRLKRSNIDGVLIVHRVPDNSKEGKVEFVPHRFMVRTTPPLCVPKFLWRRWLEDAYRFEPDYREQRPPKKKTPRSRKKSS